MLYRTGIQEYVKVFEKKFANNSLSGRVDAEGKDHGKVFRPNISFEKNSGKIHTFGDCQCALGSQGNFCPHIAALMIAWVRRSEEFEEDPKHLRSDFEAARQKVENSLKEILLLLENSSSTESLDLLQKTYSNVKLWSEAFREISNKNRIRTREFDPIREFSETINHISLAILSTIERRHDIPTIDVYNKATLTSVGKVLELFVENTRYDNKSLAVKKRKVSRKTTRSWDVLVENFSIGS